MPSRGVTKSSLTGSAQLDDDAEEEEELFLTLKTVIVDRLNLEIFRMRESNVQTYKQLTIIVGF